MQIKTLLASTTMNFKSCSSKIYLDTNNQIIAIALFSVHAPDVYKV